MYLNPNMAKDDYENNKDIYVDAVKKCRAAASCTTKTAEFTMQVKYKDKDTNKEYKVDFPYSTKKDSLASNGDESGKSCDASKNENDGKLNNESIILNYDGCYKSCEEKRWYQTEISFPGSWTNDKTGEVSWVHKDPGTGWRTHPDKFCIPVNAKDVNRTWWLWYMNYKAPNAKAPSFDYNKESYNKECKDYKSILNDSRYSETQEPAPDEYNISATVRNFGYYGWNFDVSCFYALNSAISKESADKEEIDKGLNKCNTAGSNYRIRSVANGDLFPDPNGTTSVGTDYSKTSRKPGFNWTDSARIPTDKTLPTKSLSYTSKPSDVITRIQELGENVYKDEYVDYWFRLTPKVLNEIKKYNDKVGNYNKYCGVMYNNDTQSNTYGLSVYKSNLFGSSGISGNGCPTTTNIVTAKKSGKLGCNNDHTGTCN